MDKNKSRFSSRLGSNLGSGFSSRLGGSAGGEGTASINNTYWIDESANQITDESNNIFIFIK